MDQARYKVVRGENGDVLEIRLRGTQLLRSSHVNKGTAFTKEERSVLGLTGLLPARVVTIEGQLKRSYGQFSRQPDNLQKNVYLSAMRERNEVLFYRLLSEHLEEMLPIVYTPTIGEAIERYSHTYNRPRGAFLDIDHPELIEESLRNYGRNPDEVDVVCVTDSEGILGIGDQGVGGVEITVGKLAVYTAAAGIHPRRTMPVVLDVGTDNVGLLNDEFYLGVRHSRVRGERYVEFVDQFVEAVTKLFPHALIHWEDFGASNAHWILEKYQDKCLTFNDDIQGTAAVVQAAVLAAVRAKDEAMHQQRIVVHGAGTAGVGIAALLRDEMVREGLSVEEADKRFWCLGSRGLITEHLGDRMRDFQREFSRPASEIAGWKVKNPQKIGLIETVQNVKPTILIGTSAQAGSFTRGIIKEMASHVERPIIMPLSNPTARAEAVPADILEWTDGRAMIATGSPFAPVEFQGEIREAAQANNALVFPGLGLGVAVCKASRITNGIIAAASHAVAGLARPDGPGKRLLPSINDLRTVSATVALAVCKQAAAEGVAEVVLDDPVQAVFEAMWQPDYTPIDLERSAAWDVRPDGS